MELATSLCYTSPNNLAADYNNNPRYPSKTKFNPPFYPWVPTRRSKTSGSSSLSRMVSNGYAGRSSSNYRYGDGNTVITNTNYKQRQKYTQMESCLVIPPPKGRKPRAIIKFLGGAFIGAVPEVTYR
jgi:hypothetical protein